MSLNAGPMRQDGATLAQTMPANTTYTSAYTEEGTVTLVDGEYSDPAAQVSVVLTDWLAYGDLNGDGIEDAAVVLATNTGGSGAFMDLHALVNTKDGLVDQATAFLGDRVQINALSIAEGAILVDMITQGPNDPFCCPTLPVTMRYTLEDSELIAAQKSGISLDALDNLTYTLPDLTDYVDEGRVTLVDGRFEMAAAPGSAEMVTLATTGYAAFGDLNGDTVEDAIVVLSLQTGGSGTFFYLASVLDQAGELVNNAVTLLGDRVQLTDLAIADGQIIVDMISHGPDDPLCCPTVAVEQTYGLDDAGFSLIGEVTLIAPVTAVAAELDFMADPLFATLNLGGSDTFWLDPTMVSILGGVAGGAIGAPVIEASELGAGCVGQLPGRPDAVLNWTEDETVDTLRIFFLSLGDPTMVVVTPAGETLCADDFNPLVLDPMIEIENPSAGRYAIFIGAFENEAVTPGFLTITGQEYTPANLDIAQLLPRAVDPAAARDPQPPDVLDGEPAALAELTPAALPVIEDLVGGGPVEAFNVELGNSLCTGFISAEPTFGFSWQGDAENLRLFFEAAGDSTLIVRTPQDTFTCNDDADGATNLNPQLDITPVAGDYSVWIGSFAPTEAVTGTLTITTDPDAEPVTLTSAELQEN